MATTSVDGIGVQGHVVNVEADASHVLVDHDTFLSGPLEGSFHRVLDLLKVLHLLGNIDKHVSASGLRTETPNFLGIIWIPLVLVSELSVSDLWILLGSDLVVLNSLSELISKWLGLHEDSVMLVWRF